MSRRLKTRQGEYRGARDGKAATGIVVDRSVFEQGGRGAFAAMSGGALASVAPALALAVAAALPAVAPRGFWTSVRFSARVVRCRLRRPGETPALGGVSGRFGLRNRLKVASGVRLR